MSKYRNALPQLGDELFLTDGGLETFLYFQQGIDIPEFAAFPLLEKPTERSQVTDYYRRHGAIALDNGLGFILETPTWRANPDWAAKLGYDREALAEANRDAAGLMIELRDEMETAKSKFVVSGNIGPRGDGYNPADIMSEDEAERYHAEQIDTFAAAGVDLITALTMTNTEEAIGITRAGRAAGLAVVISFTTETDGRIPVGMSLGDAIAAVDAATGEGPAYYMVNCAHTTHFGDVLKSDAARLTRIRGLRANASSKSHEELDNSTELDEGNPVELAGQYAEIRRHLPGITILGGCCGTDHRHVEEICRACIA